MENRFLEFLQKLEVTSKKTPILLGVSGGVDSMVLAELFYSNSYNISVAHCNYQLRGEDSEADQNLVRNWCKKRSVPFFGKQIETKKLAKDSDGSIQMIARDTRYRFFSELCDKHGFEKVALAHHANDRVESLLINVLRGTGLRGMQGMPSRRGKFIRPLLSCTKSELVGYATEHQVPFREDTSNSEIYYQRNWVRLRLLPMLEASNKNVFQQLISLCERVENELPNYENWISGHLNRQTNPHEFPIGNIGNSKAPFTLLKEWLEPKGFNSDMVFEVLNILDSESGSEVVSSSHKVLRDRDSLLISQLGEESIPPKLEYSLIDRNQLNSLKTQPNIALVDSQLVDTTKLKMRKWKQGNRFKPLGMKGWKLLSDYFINQKFSVLEKEQVWLLIQNDEIVWLIGHRLDDRFKVKPTTQKVLKITAQF